MSQQGYESSLVMDENVSVNINAIQKRAMVALASRLGISVSDCVRLLWSKYAEQEWPQYRELHEHFLEQSYQQTISKEKVND